MTCDCKDWEKEIIKISGAFTFMAVHGCGEYGGKKFKYCPWCGKEVKDDR